MGVWGLAPSRVIVGGWVRVNLVRDRNGVIFFIRLLVHPVLPILD